MPPEKLGQPRVSLQYKGDQDTKQSRKQRQTVGDVSRLEKKTEQQSVALAFDNDLSIDRCGWWSTAFCRLSLLVSKL